MKRDDQKHQKDSDSVAICKDVLQNKIDEIKNDELILEIPTLRDERRLIPGMQFHPNPEMFIQISGATIFAFPNEKIELLPRGICIVPSGIPHKETAERLNGSFKRLVLMYRPECLSFHVSKESMRVRGEPIALETEQFKTPHADRMVEYLVDAVKMYSENRSENQLAIRGLLLTHIMQYLNVLERESPIIMSGHFKVAQCVKFIMSHLSNPEVNVKMLAEWLQCSPDYLSSLFVKEAGIRLTKYINQERIKRAKELLKTSELNISEIAWACGYTDAGYFSRLFKKMNGVVPKLYRTEYTAKSSEDTGS